MDETLAERMPRGTAPTEFLKSHRAVTACSREIEALGDAIASAVASWHAQGMPDKPVLRKSPGRCVAQVGPVALTFAWLPATHKDIGSGELLMIVWHGIVGPRKEHQFERVVVPVPLTATEVWEEVFHPGVVGAESWRWCPAETAPEDGFTAVTLAERAVSQLRVAYDRFAVPVVSDAVPLAVAP